MAYRRRPEEHVRDVQDRLRLAVDCGGGGRRDRLLRALSLTVGAIEETRRGPHWVGQHPRGRRQRRHFSSSGSGWIKLGTVAGDARIRTEADRWICSKSCRTRPTCHPDPAIYAWRNLKGDIKASTASASIEIAGTPTTAWHATTSSGSITLAIPADTSFRLQAHTNSGSIHTNHTLKVTTTGGHELEGTTGDGSVLVEARSSSGSITVRRR